MRNMLIEKKYIGSRNIAVRRLLEIIFDCGTFVIDLNRLKSNLTSALSILRYVELCMYEVRRCTAGQRSLPYCAF